MTDLLSELEAVVGRIRDDDAEVRRTGGDPERERYTQRQCVNFLRTHHAEIAAAVMDAAYGRALRLAMECEYQAAKESRKGGKQEAWITTYSLLRRLKAAADHLTDMGNPITEQYQPLAAMRAGEGRG